MPLQVPSDKVPQHVAQTEQPDQAPLLLSRRVSHGGNVLVLDDHEAMAPPLADVGQDRGERIARGASDDAVKVVRALVESDFDGGVEDFVGVLADEILTASEAR